MYLDFCWFNSEIKLITTEARRNYLVSELNYDTTIEFSDK